MNDEEGGLGWVAFGGNLVVEGEVVTVQPRDALRKRMFVAPLGLEVEVDAGVVIESVEYTAGGDGVTVTIARRADGPVGEVGIVWLEVASAADGDGFTVSSPAATAARGGFSVPLAAGESVEVVIGQA